MKHESRWWRYSLLMTLLLALPGVPSQRLHHMRSHGHHDKSRVHTRGREDRSHGHHDKSRVHTRGREDRLAAVRDECHNGTCPSIEALARSKHLEPGETLPIVFANYEYWPTLLNGLLAQSKISPELPKTIGVVCLDDGRISSLCLFLPPHRFTLSFACSLKVELAQYLREARAPPCFRLQDHNLEESLETAGGAGEKMTGLWERRVIEAAKLLHHQKWGVLFFDADAVWQRDLRETMRMRGFDVVASRGTFPNEISRVWGATLVMGCIYFAPTEASRRLLEIMQRYINPGQPYDDQIAINRALRDVARIRWSGSALLANAESQTMSQQRPSARQGRRSQRWGGGKPLHPTQGHAGLSVGQGSLKDQMNQSAPLRVGLLPHAIAPRRCELLTPSELRSAAVLHCFCAKSGLAKRAAGRRFGTWLLPEPVATDKTPHLLVAERIFR